MDSFPLQLIEILNGILSVSLFWMLFFLVLHIYKAWSILSVHWGKARAFCKLYYTVKPEIALATLVCAFSIRTLFLWYIRWTSNHKMNGMLLLLENDTLILIVNTAFIFLGVTCWIRVISPFKGKEAFLIWLVMVITSVSFGLGMHYIVPSFLHVDSCPVC